MLVEQNILLSKIFYGLGYLVGLGALLLLAKKRQLLTDGILRMALAGLFGGLIGATVLQETLGGTSGKSIIGAIIVGYVAVVLAKKKLGITRPLGDLFAVGLAAGETVGRFGCLFAGCCYGKVTTSSIYIIQHGAHRYPTQIYMAIISGIILTILLLAERFGSLPENGLFCLYGILYCVGRFSIEYYRFGEPMLGWISLAQLACLGGLVYYGIYMTRLMRRVMPSYAQSV